MKILEKTILVDAVFTLVSDKGVINKDIYSLLEKFPHRKIILTNALKEDFRKYGLDNMPYDVFTLEKNPTKVSEGYYEKMLKYFNLNSYDCIYLEHNTDAVKKATEAGITSYHFNKDLQNLVTLEEFIKNNI